MESEGTAAWGGAGGKPLPETKKGHRVGTVRYSESSLFRQQSLPQVDTRLPVATRSTTERDARPI
jgi:hypothetical protein